jgi:SAM-dependent methyltransferase
MTLAVLSTNAQVEAARGALDRRGLSCITPEWKARLQRYHLLPGFRIGDRIKSWDILKSVEFIETHAGRDAPILDIGSYACELPLILDRLGYRRLAGVDLNPGVARMPRAGAIDYRVGDFLRAPFPDASFEAVTAISVIEHGFDGEALAKEMSRLLKPGGHFIASFDYWPEKISTEGIKLFGMSWTIFSRQEVERFVALARPHGLMPCGPLEFGGMEKPVSCLGRDYTFAWIAFRKQ